MMKKINFIFIIISVFSLIFGNSFLVSYENVYAEETEQQKICNQKDECKSSTSLLGDVNCECSVAWLLQKFLNYIRVLGPTLAILYGTIDYVKAIITSDSENMNKTGKRFIYRLIAAVALFLVPTIVSLLLSFFGITSNIATGGLV